MLAVNIGSIFGWSNALKAAPADVVGKLAWPAEWVVFLPLGREAPLLPQEVLKTMPESIEVSGKVIPGRRVKAECNGTRFDFAPLGVNEGDTAYAFLALESDKEQKVTIGMGADWWLQAWLNGEKIKDTLDDGNVVWPPSIFDFTTNATLKAGKNILAVRFISGSGSSVLTLGGPDQLRAPPLPPPPAEWRFKKLTKDKPVHQVVPNGGFEDGGGDPFIPTGWSNGRGKNAFQAGELKLDTSAPLSGNKSSLEINTLGSGPVKRKLYTRLDVDVNTLYEISFGYKYIAGDDYISISMRNELSGSDTSFIQAIGNVLIKQGALFSKGKYKGGQDKYKGTYYFDTAHPYLVIQTHGAAHVLLDDISIKPLAGSKRSFDSYSEQRVTWKVDWQTLSDEIKTPHTSWSKPYVGSKMRVVTMLPRWRQRWTVELAQRLDVSYEPVMFNDQNNPDNDYWVRGADGEPEIFRVRDVAMSKLSAPTDCIVIGYLSPSTITNELVKRVLEQVEAGAGLVILGYDQPFWPYPDGKQPLDKYCEGVWSKALNEGNRIKEGVSYISLGPVEGAEEAFYKYGKGRIAFLRKTPVVGAVRYSRGEFEMELSYIMKAMLWASDRLPSARMSQFIPPGAPADKLRGRVARKQLPDNMKVTFNAPLPAAGALTWWLDDYNLLKIPGGEIQLAAGSESAQMELPRLPGGEHWLHMQLKTEDGKIIDWNTVGLKVLAEPGIKDIKLSRDKPPYYRAGERIEGDVLLSGAAGDGYLLRLRLTDADGHLWREKEIAAGNGTEIKFSLETDKAPVLMHNLVAELIGPDGVVDIAGRELAVVRENDWYRNNYDFQLWQMPWCACFPYHYLGQLVSGEIRKHGITSAHYGSSRINAYNNIRTISIIGKLGTGALLGDKLHAPERDPCLSDSGYRQGQIAKVIEDYQLPDTLPYAPLAYEVGSEVNLLGFGSIQGKTDADICFSPHCLASFRSFLRREYETLPALNKAWGTDFQDWDKVCPIVLADAIKEGQVTRWIDHRRHMDWVFADFGKYEIDLVRKKDPEAQAVGDNLREPTSFSGVDYWLLFSEVMGGAALPEPYLLSFVPPERRHLTWRRYAYWHPNMVTPDENLFRQRIEAEIWSSLFQGMHGSVYYAELFLGGPDGYCPPIMMMDLRITDYNRWSTESIAQIRTGIDRLIFESKRDNSGIAVLYSRSSEHAATAWQKIQGGDIAGQLHTKGQVDLFTSSLKLLGYQYGAVSEQQITNDWLKEHGIKMLILPFAQAIDSNTVSRIKEFVAGGGILMADIRPAVGDRHGRLAERGQLDEVFGVSHDTKWTSYIPEKSNLTLDGKIDALTMDKLTIPTILGPKIGLSGAVSLCETNGRPVLAHNRYGSGQTILLNFTPSTIDASVLDMLGKLLKWQGLNPQFGLKTIETRRPEMLKSGNKTKIEQAATDDGMFADAEGFMGASGMAAPEGRPTSAHYINGNIHFFAFWRTRDDRRRGAGTERLRITPPQTGHIYDIKNNLYLGKQESFEATVTKEGFNAYAVVPYRIGKPSLDVSEDVTTAGNIRLVSRVRVAPAEAAKERHVVRLRLFAPDGGEWKDFAENIVVSDGAGTYEFILPLNAPRGKWKVEAREAISGLAKSVSVRVK